MPFLLALVLISCQKEEFSPIRTSEFTIHASSNGADYPIKVAVPEGYDPDHQQYATIYVLDGDENFDFVTTQCESISHDRATDNVLVVSIGYGNDRAVDYTPSTAEQGGGKAAAFMQFIHDDLIPRIESEFAADTTRESRVIIGHSFGGLFAAYAFTSFNHVFGNYLMLSPSLWYDNEIILLQEQDHRDEIKANHQLVYLGLGELEKSGRMLVPFQAFYQQLEDNYPGIALERQLQPHLDHQGSKQPNIIEGLQFYFQNR